MRLDCQIILACPDVALTETSTTPSKGFNVFSTLKAHAAQCIPSITICDSHRVSSLFTLWLN